MRRRLKIWLIFLGFIIIWIIIFNLLRKGPSSQLSFVQKKAEAVSMITKDGIILQGVYKPPEFPNDYVFVLLHGLGSSKEEWNEFSDKLSSVGFGYLRYDARGHGESIKDKKENLIDFRFFSYNDWNKMVDDLETVVKFLKKKGVSDEKIGLIGASLGANVCLNYAVRNYKIPLCILLSVGIQYQSVSIKEAIKKFGNRRLLLAVSPGDRYAYESNKIIFKIAKSLGTDVEFIEGVGSLHGVEMFKKGIDSKIIEWLRRNI